MSSRTGGLRELRTARTRENSSRRGHTCSGSLSTESVRARVQRNTVYRSCILMARHVESVPFAFLCFELFNYSTPGDSRGCGRRITPSAVLHLTRDPGRTGINVLFGSGISYLIRRGSRCTSATRDFSIQIPCAPNRLFQTEVVVYIFTVVLSRCIG